MRKVYYYLFIVTVIFGSCSKDEDKQKIEGEVILSSEKVKQGSEYNTIGFSFEKGENVPYPITTDAIPDLVVTHFVDLEDNLIVTFTSPNNQEAFYLNQTFSSASEAQTWYDNYYEAIESGYVSLANEIKINQVWTVQTINKKYAKLLIKKIQLLNDSPVADYVEVTAYYKYQPDGTRIFDNK